MEPAELPDDLYARITRLSEEGNELCEGENYDQAIERFQTAYDILPEPKHEWDAATWLLAGIGDCLFLQGDYHEAVRYFRQAQKCPGGAKSPFIFYRLGQCLYELEEPDEEAADALISAYMLAGKEILLSGDPKYFEFLRAHADIEGKNDA